MIFVSILSISRSLTTTEMRENTIRINALELVKVEKEQEKEQVPQQPNPEYQEQFDSQAFWANSFAEDQYEYKLENPTKMDKLLHRKLKFPVKMTPIDMAHAEALKVDSLVEEAHKHGPFYRNPGKTGDKQSSQPSAPRSKYRQPSRTVPADFRQAFPSQAPFHKEAKERDSPEHAPGER